MRKIILFAIIIAQSVAVLCQNITSVSTASNQILVVHLETDWIEIKEEERETTYNDLKPDLNSWQINSNSPIEVGLYSSVIDEKKKIQINWENFYPIKLEHKIYLKFDNYFQDNTLYVIQSPYGNFEFTFNSDSIFCESIKVNQVGYNINSTVSYANFGIFKGDLGSEELTNTPEFYVIDSLTNEIAYQGNLVFVGNDTGTDDMQSGEYVYRMDLSQLNSGTYYIKIPQMGKSYYFGVGENYSKLIAKTHLRGMFHQRCGIALEQPYTRFEREICHEQVAFTKYEGSWAEGEGWIDVPGNAELHNVIGGYHDAGDYDRRIYHTIIPLLFLNYYEAFSENFIDNQYNIPESGNGIPDFLDEATWATLVWENLQLNENNSDDPSEYGGIMAGTESDGHPEYGVDRADSDDRVYGTYAVSEHTTYAGCGFFAQLARLIRNYDAQRANILYEKALAAWNYAQNNSFNEDKAFKMYAALQLYLITAEEDITENMNNEYHIIFRDIAQEYIVNGGEWPYQYLAGNNSAKITTSHFISYLLTDKTTDETLNQQLYNAIKEEADYGGYMEWMPDDYPYPQGVTRFVAWGSATAQGRYADAAAFMYRLTENEQEKQEYYNIVSQLGDYSLGLNPLGMSYVTGLGDKQVNSPLHLDSYYTKYGLTPTGETQTVKGNVPGIVIYGYTESRSGTNYQTAVSDFLYPQWENLPMQRRWTDGWSLVNSNEFTVWETMIWNTCMYGVLYNASTDFTTKELIKSEKKTYLSVYPNPVVNEINITGNFSSVKTDITISIYDITGKEVEVVNSKSTGAEIEKLTIYPTRLNKPGLYYLKINTNNKILHSEVFVKSIP